jgi:hypothetical protein
MFGARDHNSLHFRKHRKSIQLKIDCDKNFRLFKKKPCLWRTTGHQAAVSIGRFSLFGKWSRPVRKGINRRTGFDFSLLFQKHTYYIHGFFAGSLIQRVGSSKTWSWRSFDPEIFQNLGPEFCDSEF